MRQYNANGGRQAASNRSISGRLGRPGFGIAAELRLRDLASPNSTDRIPLEGPMTGHTRLLITNLPSDCKDLSLRLWIESRGYQVSSIRLIQDVVSGTSPSFAHVALTDEARLEEAARILNGEALGGRTVGVQPMRVRAASA